MLALIIPGPLMIAPLHTTHLGVFYLLSPLVSFFVNMWVGSAVATVQDCVLPRMRGTAGAMFILATSMLGLAIGPYSVGKVAVLSGSLGTGIMSLLGMMVVGLMVLWTASGGIKRAEETALPAPVLPARDLKPRRNRSHRAGGDSIKICRPQTAASWCAILTGISVPTGPSGAGPTGN